MKVWKNDISGADQRSYFQMNEKRRCMWETCESKKRKLLRMNRLRELAIFLVRILELLKVVDHVCVKDECGVKKFSELLTEIFWEIEIFRIETEILTIQRLEWHN